MNCWNTCATPNAACPSAGPSILAQAGTCIALGGNNLCAILSQTAGICGGGANGVCALEEICLTDQTGVGFCTDICDGANPTGCTTAGVPPAACGCQAGLECSNDPGIGLTITGSTDGVCVAPTNVGDPCGIIGLDTVLCSPGQECTGLAQGTPQGTCADAAVGDAGVPDDAGN